ncbi:hypothetical protein D9M71_265160 [compost metagenome]
MDAVLVRIVGRVVEGTDDRAEHFAAAHVDVEHVEAGVVLFEGGDAGQPGAAGPAEQHAVDGVVSHHQQSVPVRIVEQAEESAEHALLEVGPGLATQEGRPLHGCQAICPGYFTLAALLGNLAQTACTDFPQGGQLLDQHPALAQHQFQGLPGARIGGAQGTIEGRSVEHPPEGRGLFPAAQRQRHEARVQRTAVGIEVVDMAMPDQIAAATHNGNGIRHDRAPWDC